MPRLPLIVLCLVCGVMPLAVGCGGEDDPKPRPDAGPTPIPDAGTPDAGSKPDAGGPTELIPPEVVSHSPLNNAVAVPPERQIEVTFNEPMQPDRGLLSIQPGTGLPNNGLLTARPENWDGIRQKVTFTFPQGLPLRARLTVTVTGFADVAGNPMATPKTFSFTVGDGQPPTVSQATPAEGASNVPLNTASVSFEFTEPMDQTVGTLTPSGGLVLGGGTWTNNKTFSAPITGGLVYNGTYSVRLNNFRNANLKALDGTVSLGDGKLDFSTGPDMTKPAVQEASPAEGATGVLPENTEFIVLFFSEPMDTAVGKADLVDSSGTTVLTPSWSADGFSVSYDVRNRLRYNSATRVVLSSFRDRVGNLLDPALYLGDGELDFATGADTIKPYVVSSTPVEGAQDVYPVEVYTTGTTPPTGRRKVFTFRFNEPMDLGIRRVTLRETHNPGAFRTVDGVWSGDGLTLTVTVLPVTGSPNQLPLLEQYYYSVDLRELKDRNGNAFDAAHPSLGDGLLDFETLRNSEGANHACEHALLLNPIAITGTSAGNTAPRADTLHSRYAVTLPSNGTSFSGFVRMDLAPETFHTLYLDKNTQVAVIDPATGLERQVTQIDVAPACAQLTHRATFETPRGTTVHVRFGPSLNSTLRIVPEQYSF